MWYTFDGKCLSKTQAKRFRQHKERKLALLKQKLGFSYELMPQDLLYWRDERKVVNSTSSGYIFDDTLEEENYKFYTGYIDFIAYEKEKKRLWKQKNIRLLKDERLKKLQDYFESLDIPKTIINMKEKTEHALAAIDNWENLTDRALVKKLALYGIQEELQKEGLTFHKAIGIALKEMFKDKTIPWHVRCKTLIYAADKLGIPEEDTSRNNVVVLAGMSQQDIDAEKVIEINNSNSVNHKDCGDNLYEE